MTKFKRYEVVRVDSPSRLLSAKHQTCCNEAPGDKPLAPGYYLVLWSSWATDSIPHGRDLQYLGPVASPAEAQWLKTSALALGIVEPPAHVANPGRIPPAVQYAEQLTV